MSLLQKMRVPVMAGIAGLTVAMTGCDRVQTKYSQPKEITATITKKRYTPQYAETTMQPLFVSEGTVIFLPSTHIRPARYDVTLATKLFDAKVNDQSVFEKYEIGNAVPITYREKYYSKTVTVQTTSTQITEFGGFEIDTVGGIRQ